MVRLFFAADFHGSTAVWKKYLKAYSRYGCDTLLAFGDLTGKAIIPIIEAAPKKWYCNPFGSKINIHSEEELNRRISEFEARGYYCFTADEDGMKALQEKPKKVEELFVRLMKERLRSWLSMVRDECPPDVEVIVSPGNDDHLGVDEVIRKDERVVYPLNRVIAIGETYKMISCEWVNSTPWDTPRECSERELREKLETEMRRVDEYESLLCNFHAPPYATNLDEAPKLDKDLKPVRTLLGAPITEHVGSKAVKEVIQKYQPFLSLSGHIHESTGHCYFGRTLCLNPGSDYQRGRMLGYVIDLPPSVDSRIEFWKVES